MLHSAQDIYAKFRTSGGRVNTDTRQIGPGDMFFALRGPNFNGNEYAAKALETGAAFCVCDRETGLNDERILMVQDVLETLQELARIHRRTLGLKLLAIGGSNGKTTTKELCLMVLGARFRAKATKGNFNNHIGLPLTILSFDDETELGIVELGTNHPGEMELLCEIASAQIGIVTNIGKEHLEGFGSIEAVAKEESFLIQQLIDSGGKVLLNADDPWLSAMGKRMDNKLSFGIENNLAALNAHVIGSMPHLIFELSFNRKNLGKFQARIGGRHNLYNILSAIAAGISMGMDAVECAELTCSYRPSNNRSEWVHTADKSILLDAYNANPSSMEAILKEFAGIPTSKCALLGDMLELGDAAAVEHREIAELAAGLGMDELYFVGENFMREAPKGYLKFNNVEELNVHLKSHPIKSSYVMVKGSRGIRMEKVMDVLGGEKIDKG